MAAREKVADKNVATTELAAVLGISARRVQQLAQDGILDTVERGKFELGAAVQAAALLGGALLFGGGAYPRLELLRAWSGGSFSRMDALLLLLWLLCAVYRAAMLCATIRLLWQQPKAEVQP